MKCNYCGTENADGSKFCTGCGAALNNMASATTTEGTTMNTGYANPAQATPAYNANTQQYAQNNQYYAGNMQYAQNPQYGQYNQYGQYGQQGYTQMTKNDFLELPAMEKQKKNVKACYIICYICAVLSLVISIAAGQINIVDPIILAGLGLWIQFGKSFVAGVLLLAYSIINVIYLIVATGQFGGYLIVIAGIYAVITTYKINKAYKEYKNTGIIPTESVG